MSSFATDGFLSAEQDAFGRAIASRYSTKLQLAEDTNRIMHRIIYAVKPHSEHLPDLILAALLIRQASSYQGFLILLGKGLETQAQILLRNLAEMMFITGAIRRDENFVNQYVLSEDISRVKSLEAIVKDKQTRGEDVDEDTTKLIGVLRERIRDEELTTFSTERIARIAGLSSYYDTLYRFTSMAVHASPRELNGTLEVDSSGNIVSLRYEPVVEGLDMYLDYGISMMLYVLHEVATHFSVELVPEIESLQQRNRETAGPTSHGTQS